MIQFGNKVSFSENKTRRTWKPNVQNKSMYSETLGRMLRFRMTTYAMRCIKKAGGIEQYLLKTKESEIKYLKALKIKEEIIAVRAAQRAAAEKSLDQDTSSVAQDRNGGKQVEDSSRKGAVVAKSSPLQSTEPARYRPPLGLLDVLTF